MIKAFLSHSSADKERFVRIVADKLRNKMNIHYDEYTFEAGNKTIDEIFLGLEQTDLFVFFISDNSLKSEWVKKELLIANNNRTKTKQFYPIIIDKNIKYNDERIPNWIKEYNLKYVAKPTIVARRIEQKLREISLSKHPKLMKKNNLCIGRNKILEEFEQRLDDFNKDKPKCIITTGLESIGRRTFLNFALQKTDITDQNYAINDIYLNTDDSIEDFIFKINDLGFLDINDDLQDLLSKKIEDKINIALKLIKEIQEHNELILILDNGCIINFERKISNWFKQIIESDILKNQVTICTASKYKVDFKEIYNDNFFSIHVDELNVSERKRLFKRLLEIYEINISNDDFNYFSNVFYGFPEQIIYCVDYISRTTVDNVKNKLNEIREFNDEKASMLIKHYQEKDEILSIIRLLAQFEIISKNLIFNITDNKNINNIIDSLVTENICEYFGYDGQFIRVNDSIRDYIKRNNLKVKDEYTTKIREHVRDFIASDDKLDTDSGDYLFSIKQALLEGKNIDDSYLLPSHFLRTMKDLYYEKNYTKVISLARKVLEKEEFIDEYLANDIKYYLCLALVKQKNKEVLKEVQNIRGEQHNFILGYYYRNIRNYEKALEKLSSIVNSKYIQARAKREMVHCYIQTEGYSKALSFAKETYIENKTIFNVQLYFNCLIFSDKYYKNIEEIERIKNELVRMSNEINIDMGDRAKALYYARIENKEKEALSLIDETIIKYPDSYYSLLTKFDIAFKFKNIEEMENSIFELEQFNHGKLPETIYIKQKAYLIALKEKNSVKARELIFNELKNYPKEARDLINDKLENLSK
ncbi:toll/interleukin-1 receptor domain-containing protein [Arcobacter porcinus]|uniref:toll/interleukin-1 receptor domain-containing protein n=1 Tax=Arcobacter porcinus TaxID=1935204 RepID=UPI00081F0353|nr:toll/interleukin-1 receptor domain-containing protein [Arcobacter porcinus]OCL81891.1 TIR domain protein [Arcobacter porcinus]